MTARGNERKAIFRTEADRRHFLALLGTLAERFGVLVHAYVLRDNHFQGEAAATGKQVDLRRFHLKNA